MMPRPGAGNETGAARAASRAWVRWQTCTGRIPYALSRAPSGLSDREREIAVLAGGGAASREIATELVLSVRTVDNHLRSVYRTLGIDGRQDIPSVLGSPAG